MTPRRREAFINYLAVLNEEGVVRKERTVGENAAHVATAAAGDFVSVGLAPARSRVADLLDAAAARVRGRKQ